MLRDVDARIERGVTAVLGPSGSGKSTLLRLLNRLADPSAGTVRFDGDDVRDLDVLALRRRAVLVPQLPAPLPGTVAHNVQYGPALIGRSVDAGRLLTLAGLSPDYADRQADRLAVGEQQRLMLARALALEPEALLLDEPVEQAQQRRLARAGGAQDRRRSRPDLEVQLAQDRAAAAGQRDPLELEERRRAQTVAAPASCGYSG